MKVTLVTQVFQPSLIGIDLPRAKSISLGILSHVRVTWVTFVLERKPLFFRNILIVSCLNVVWLQGELRDCKGSIQITRLAQWVLLTMQYDGMLTSVLTKRGPSSSRRQAPAKLITIDTSHRRSISFLRFRYRVTSWRCRIWCAYRICSPCLDIHSHLQLTTECHLNLVHHYLPPAKLVHNNCALHRQSLSTAVVDNAAQQLQIIARI
jgi:hypothetical protein